MQLLKTCYKCGRSTLKCSYHVERSQDSEFALSNGRETVIAYSVFELSDRGTPNIGQECHFSPNSGLTLADFRRIVEKWDKAHGKRIGKQGFRRIR